MVEISESAKFYSNIGLYYIVAKIKITKYNHIHQSCFSHCDINLINLLQCRMAYYVMEVGEEFMGFKTRFPHKQKLFFFMKSRRKKKKK